MVGHKLGEFSPTRTFAVTPVTEKIISVVTGIQESENKKNRIKWVLEKNIS